VVLGAPPANVAEDAPVPVTFFAPGETDLAAHGISPEQAAQPWARLASFAADWDTPAVPAYDNYDVACATVLTR